MLDATKLDITWEKSNLMLKLFSKKSFGCKYEWKYLLHIPCHILRFHPFIKLFSSQQV